jgi:hypothetical protein
MTEEEWLRKVERDSPLEMVRALNSQFSPGRTRAARKPRDRKLRLFGCAACRRIWPLIPVPEQRETIEIVEQHADGLVTAKRLAAAYQAAVSAQCSPLLNGKKRSTIAVAYAHAARAVCLLSDPDYAQYGASFVEDVHTATVNDPDDPTKEHIHQKALLLDIFGNPFRPVAFAPEWRTATAVSLARQMYGAREFGAMPILADALQDAGCDNDDVLNHCRGSGPHVRGCWVVDLVLGKE